MATGSLGLSIQNNYASRFAWSPDGLSLAWIQGSAGASPLDIYTAAAAGSQTGTVVRGAFPTDLTFTLDGRSVVFSNSAVPASVPGGAFSFATPGIFSVPVTGGTPKQILQGSGALPGGPSRARGRQPGQLRLASPAWRVRPPDRRNRGGLPTSLMTHVLPSTHDAVAWSDGDMAAFLLASATRPALTIIRGDGTGTATVDTGVSAFGWPPKAA